MRGGRRFVFWMGIFGLVLPPPSVFGDSMKAQDKLQHEVVVSLKLVQVYVVDKSGNAVSDLTPADFELYDDGVAKPITDFEIHRLSLDRLPEDLRETRASASRPEMRRKFFLFFDFAFNSRAGISKARRAALEFLDKQVRPEDQVGILSFSSRQGLTLHEYLTFDHQKIREIIESFGPGRSLGRAWRLESEWLRDHLKLDEALGGGSGGDASTKIPSGNSEMTKKILGAEMDVVKREAVDYVSQISEMAKALRGIPGIKNIILFSSGIPNSMLYGGYFFTQRDWGDASLRDRYNVMCRELAGSNSTVFGVNVSGTGSAAAIEDRDLMGDGSLRQLAKDTGGRYFDNIYSHEKINATIQKLTGTYYVLGYVMDEQRDGRFHDVRVEVKRKGCSVYGQKGYFDPKPFSEYSENEKLLHLIDLAMAEKPVLQVPAEVSLTALPIVDKGKPVLIAFFGLPRSLAPQALGNRAEAFCLLFDNGGKTVAIVPLRIENPDLEKDFVQIVFAVPAQPGRVTCRIALCNMETGFGVRAVQSLTVPEAREDELRLDPPLLLGDPRSEGAHTSQGASLEDLYGYDARDYSPLYGDLAVGTKSVWAALRLTSARPQAEIELTARLEEPEETIPRSIPVALIKESLDGSTKKLLLEIATGELKAGRHILSLIAREKDGQILAQTSAVIIVK